MSVEKIAQYISEQVRKERALGLHGIHDFNEATERTAVKNELNKLGSALGEVGGRERTGVHAQTTSPKISTSHHSKDKVGKVLSAAGYKKVGQSAEHPNFPGRSDHSYEKTDEHGFKHSVKHSFDTNNRHSVHHVGASKSGSNA